jgi:hypothetical protein
MSGTEMYESGECERDVMIKSQMDQEEKKNETKKTEGEEEGERRVGRSSNSTQEKK